MSFGKMAFWSIETIVIIADDLILLGREDLSMGSKRKAWSELINPYEGEGALIVADHQPYDNEQLAIEKSALQLSGHTRGTGMAASGLLPHAWISGIR